MTWLMYQSALENPNSPIYDWRFWAWCISTTIIGFGIAAYIERKKP